MLAPRSYTREDVVELQCHGSDVCLHRVLRACLEAGARLAEPGYVGIQFHSIPIPFQFLLIHSPSYLHSIPFLKSGEFTLRAFLNGRLDLSQAEDVGKLISAKSMAAADAALAGIQASLYTF